LLMGLTAYAYKAAGGKFSNLSLLFKWTGLIVKKAWMECDGMICIGFYHVNFPWHSWMNVI
jgi:hypothetical protein